MQHIPVNLGQFKGKKTACLTLDVEHDYGTLLSRPTYDGLNNIPPLVDLLREKDLPLSCYIQGSLFETHGKEIACFSRLDTEFAAHSYSHPSPARMNFEYEIEKSKEAY